jgi:hypothetical protein
MDEEVVADNFLKCEVLLMKKYWDARKKMTK